MTVFTARPVFIAFAAANPLPVKYHLSSKRASWLDKPLGHVELAAYISRGMCVRAYRYASVDASKMAQKLCREIWCRSITAAYRTCVYLRKYRHRFSAYGVSKSLYEQPKAARSDLFT